MPDEVVEALQALDKQITDVVKIIAVTKANAWVEQVEPNLPLPIGDVTITSIETGDGAVVLQGHGTADDENFWPWTIVNPPLNVDADGNSDILGALTDIVERVQE